MGDVAGLQDLAVFLVSSSQQTRYHYGKIKRSSHLRMWNLDARLIVLSSQLHLQVGSCTTTSRASTTRYAVTRHSLPFARGLYTNAAPDRRCRSNTSGGAAHGPPTAAGSSLCV